MNTTSERKNMDEVINNMIMEKLENGKMLWKINLEQFLSGKEAELATCFLCGEAGIANNTVDNSASFIQFWIERLTHMLKEDNKAFIRAAQAQKATDFIMNSIEEVVLWD